MQEVIKLKHSIKVDGSECKELTMRLPRVKDMLLANKTVSDGDAVEKDIVLYANLCEVAPEELHELAMVDWDRLHDAYDKLVPERPEPSVLRLAMMNIAQELNEPVSAVADLDAEEFLGWCVAVHDKREAEKAATRKMLEERK